MLYQTPIIVNNSILAAMLEYCYSIVSISSTYRLHIHLSIQNIYKTYWSWLFSKLPSSMGQGLTWCACRGMPAWYAHEHLEKIINAANSTYE